MAKHKFMIEFDDSTGECVGQHRCVVDLAGHAVGHSREVAMPAEVAAAMKQFVDHNRAIVEAEANALAVTHVSALQGKKQPGVKSLSVGGSLLPVSNVETEKT